MMINNKILVALLFVSTFAHAEFETYFADGVPHKIETSRALQAVNAYTNYASSLESCSKLDVTFTDPLVNTKQGFKVGLVDGLCRVEVNRDNSFLYACYLPSAVRESLSTHLKQRIESRDLFGDFSDKEQAIYFNNKQCTES
ncbi:MAG: hypothetical protein HAW67_02625 [Endozoicomonadaceae bacterium]|nr:hypothetical protein [Endozoicomonadaceae bacterium]